MGCEEAGKHQRCAVYVESGSLYKPTWFSLSDEGVEDAVYDSYAMRRFMGLDFAVE